MKCTGHCKLDKPLEDFHNAVTPSGKAYRCKECTSIDNAKNYNGTALNRIEQEYIKINKMIDNLWRIAA